MFIDAGLLLPIEGTIRDIMFYFLSFFLLYDGWEVKAE